MNDYKKHKHYALAYHAFYNTSFDPEKRALNYLVSFDSEIEELKKLGVPEKYIEKYEKLWVLWMQRKSRCLSSMVTGPANFPVARNEKAMNAEHRACVDCSDYYKKISDKAKLEAYYREYPEKRPVMATDENAIERLQEKLEACKKRHEEMKAHNKAGIGEKYYLANNLAEIKRIEGRIKEIETRKSQESKEININGIRILQNNEAMRLQIFFEGKPSQDIISVLKKHAFKWAPSIKAWQRQLTGNAVFSFNHYVMPELKKL